MSNMRQTYLWGISKNFSLLSPCIRQVIHALLTRPPLVCYLVKEVNPFSLIPHPFDLHVLGTPPAFILSQDQTLILIVFPRQLLAIQNTQSD